MLTKVLWQAFLATPCILGVTLVASISPSLAEIGETAEPALTTATEVTTPPEPQAVGGSSASPVTSAPIVSTVVSSIVPATSAATILSQSHTSELHIGQLDRLWTTESAELVSSSPNFSAPITPSEQQPTLTLQTWATDGELTPLQASGLEVSQTTVIPAAASDRPNEPQTTASQPTRWHFLFQPYIYIPITIYGNTTFGRLGPKDFAISPDQIRSAIQNKLDFAFLGDLQAWTPNYRWGLLANVDYISTSNKDTFNRQVRRPGLADFVPSELQTDVDTEVWSVDLAATYRFYNQSKVNPKGVSTEFDLGPLLFDVIGGLSITGVNADLDLSTNLGGEASFDRGTTVVSPLLGGRLRVNASPKFALVTQGSVSGFGIGGLTQWGALAGLDWMFSGNTSLGLGYRFGSVSYNNNFDSGKDFEVNLDQNGPYLSFSFRF